ncbi:MAG: dTMP kinase [Chlamydiales bacterium]
MKKRNNPSYPGLFITIEGGEGSGKTTVCKHLKTIIESYGYSVMATREPGGSLLSEALRHLLLDSKNHYKIGNRAELFLFLAARAQHIEDSISPSLYRGEVVVCDRFNDSSIAYQGYGRDLGLEYVEKLCQLATGGLEPDITFLLDLDPLIGMERLKHRERNTCDRLEQEMLQFHQKTRQGYLDLANQYPGRIAIIDAVKPLEFVVQSCFHRLQNFLPFKS